MPRFCGYGATPTNYTYKYNADGLRTEKTVDDTTTWEYYWDNDKLIGMYDGTNEWRFYYDANDEPIGFIRGGSTYNYVKNLQGDIVKILDNYCNEIVTYTYDSWGNLISQGGSATYTNLGRQNPLRYRGYFYDTDTGLYYLQSRYYNPEWGRFVNGDEPIADSTNLYEYCGDNPINEIDPSGFVSVTLCAYSPVSKNSTVCWSLKNGVFDPILIVGHVYLEITSDGKKYRAGFYPNDCSSSVGLAGLLMLLNVKSRFNSKDVSIKGAARKTFTITDSNFNKLLVYIKKHKDDKYHLSKYNCATFAIKALEAAGIKHGMKEKSGILVV